MSYPRLHKHSKLVRLKKDNNHIDWGLILEKKSKHYFDRGSVSRERKQHNSWQNLHDKNKAVYLSAQILQFNKKGRAL